MTSLPDPKAKKRRSARDPGELKTICLQLETITPILGGAAVPRTVDKHDPVRVSGIRGQLRFWWRALCVHAVHQDYRDDWPRKLAEKEARLWGGVGAAAGSDKVARSRVDIWLEAVELSEVDPDDIAARNRDAYALWPARKVKGENKPPAERWKRGLRFRLCVRYPVDEADEVTRALRAWIWFGGVGSRTRRGCGSVTVVGPDARQWLPGSVQAIENELGGVSLRGQRDPREALDTPSLHGAALLYGGEQRDGQRAWYDAIDWLRDFRQQPDPQTGNASDFAREPEKHKGKNHRAGRSKWPEADNVRRLVRPRGPWVHDPRYGAKENVWPRASFGLPIIGQFQQKDIDDNLYQYREPGNFELRWRDRKNEVRDRLASPLIVKALPLASGRFMPIALWLFRKYPDGEVILYHNNAVGGSAAPFDKLLGKDDTALYRPLAAGCMHNAFFDWVERHGKNVRRLGK